MTARRLVLAVGLAVLAGGGYAAIMLSRETLPPAPDLAEDYECTTCDARAASKARQREALQKARDEASVEGTE